MDLLTVLMCLGGITTVTFDTALSKGLIKFNV